FTGAGSGAAALAKTAETLAKTMNLPLGMAIGIGTAAVAFEHFNEKLAKTKEGIAELKAETAKSMKDVFAGGIEGAIKELEELEKKRQAVVKDRGNGKSRALFSKGVENVFTL